MQYRKQFAASLLIYPMLYKNEYFDYIKEKVNNWIFDCFNVYTDYFTISVAQPSDIAKFYDYDKRDDGSNINFEKIWNHPYGSYYIYIEGIGDVLMGTKNTNPPRELVELVLNTMNLKYKEYSSIDGLKMITFGKDSGLPCEYSCNCCDVENWRSFISDEIDCISQDWRIALNVGKEYFDHVFNIINKLVDLEANNEHSLDLEIDEEEGFIEASGIYLLRQSLKQEYFNIITELAEVLIQDDLFFIEDINMSFVAVDKKVFYFEKYVFNDIVGSFQRKSVLL